MAEYDDDEADPGVPRTKYWSLKATSPKAGLNMSRLFIIAAILGIAIGLPYLASRPSSGQNADKPAPAGSSAVPPVMTASAAAPAINGAGSTFAGSGSLESAPFHAIEQVLRFDVTKEWVYANWPRKSTGATDVGLFSLRVPLVTGTHIGALAGSLTYYFNGQGQVEHISFRGRTGDTTPLVHFLTRTYEFQRVEAPISEQLYQVKRGRRVQSELRTRSESVLSNSSPHRSFSVELELARPGTKRTLPPRGPALQLPQVASSPPPQQEHGASDSSSGPIGMLQPYLDKVRYATPQEEGQVLWKRWPN